MRVSLNEHVKGYRHVLWVHANYTRATITVSITTAETRLWERDRETKMVKVSLKWSHTLFYNHLWMSHIGRKRHSYLMLAVQFLKKAKKRELGRMSIYDTSSNIIKSTLKRDRDIQKRSLQSIVFYKNNLGALPSSSDTSSISSTVSGKLMRCFSVVVCKAQRLKRK